MLNKIAMITFIIGIFLLLFLSQNIEPKLIKINKIQRNQLDNYIRVQGRIIETYNTKNFTLISIQDNTSDITITINQNLSFQKNQILEVTGKVIQFNNQIEIEATKVKLE